MATNPSIPLVVLLLAGGLLSAGLLAQASALDRRIGGLPVASEASSLDVPRATGHAQNGSIDVVHLDVEAETAGTVHVGDLGVRDDGRPTAAEIEPVRDEDGSLADDRLNGNDLVRVTVQLATPIDEDGERSLTVDPGEGEASEVVVEAPSALDDGYHRLALR